MAAKRLDWTPNEMAEVFGYLANPRTNLQIEIQVPPDRQMEFENDYRRKTGQNPPPEGEAGYSVLSHLSDKRSMQKRVIFSPVGSTPQHLADIVQNDTNLDNWRVSRNLLVDAMLQGGFVMGEPPSADAVRDQLDAGQLDAFDLGYDHADV